MRGLVWQTLQLSLAGGLETKGDVRAADSRQMDIARDVKFDETGGVQTRRPFGSVFGSGAIFGGGTLSNCRRLAVVNDELCVFTDTALYTWNVQLDKWVFRSTHLAVSVDETPRCVTTGDQIQGDRAELNGTIVYAWTENAQVFAAAFDKTTGSVLVAPTAVSTAIGRPRLVALATKIMFFVEASTTLLTVRAIDPAAPGTAIAGAGTTVLATNFNLFYDVVRAGTQDLVVGACRRVTTTSYQVFTVTPGLVVTSATKARTCDGPIAVATIADGTQTQIVRANGFNIQGDLLTTSTFADVFTAQAIGTIPAVTAVNNVTAAFSGTTCSAFYSGNEATGFQAFELRTNTVTTANVIGTQALLVEALGLASRAFVDGGNVYVWAAFGSDSGVGNTSPAAVRAQLQNTYYLYRSDGNLVAKSAWEVGGGLAPSIGHLPGVAATAGVYSWLGAFRRTVSLGTEGQTNLDARSPLDIATIIDDAAARRIAVIGKTMYVSGGIINQYDGRVLAEVGFCVYPWAFGASDNGIGQLSAGTYTWKATMHWTNAQGEVERSTTATGTQLTLANQHSADLQPVYLFVTKKNITPPNIELWRQQVNGTEESPYYLCTGTDRNTTTGNNHYIPNDSGSTYSTHLIDNFSDATLARKEANPENGSVLEALAPPGAKIIFATDTRIFLGGLSGDPDSVAYSRLRGTGEIASFHDGNVFPVPPGGGIMTAIASISETLVVFRESAIYSFSGQGFDNLGQGFNFGPSSQISSDVGAVSAESVALTPLGIIFKSRKGWYVATLGGVRYIGAAVAAFDADTVRAVHVMESEHEVRILTSGRLLAWDYQAVTEAAPMGQWAERTIADGVHATIWNGSYVYLTPTGPRIEQTTYSGVDYGLDVETSWIKASDLQGAVRVRAIEVLGEYRSDFLLRVRVARDYQYDGVGNVLYYDDVPWAPSPTVVGSALQHRHMPTQGMCEAIKVRLTAVSAGTTAALVTNTLSSNVTTSGTAWLATIKPDALPGNSGNVVTLSVAFDAVAGPFVIDVRDHFTWSQSLQRWREDVDNVGVRVTCNAGSMPTVAQLEASITSGSTIASVTTADPTPGKTVNAAMIGTAVTGSCTGGAYGTPTGEACKLTGLALEVGIKPGLHRRLSAEQKA